MSAKCLMEPMGGITASPISTLISRHNQDSNSLRGSLPIERPVFMVQHLWIHNIDRLAGTICRYLVEDVRELNLVLIPADVSDVRRAYDVFHTKQRMACVQNRLFLIDVDCSHSRTPRL